MAFGDQDLVAAFQGPGTVPIVLGSSSTRGFLDTEHADVLDASGHYTTQARRTTILIQTGSLLGLAVGSVLEVGEDGKEYEVRGSNELDDGVVTELIVVAV